MAVEIDYTDRGGIRNDFGDWIWRDKQGGLHREDGPAIVRPNGIQEWWLHGKRHRVDGPAWIGADGSRHWFLNGKRHRVDGPALIWPDGSQEWWLHGRRHRAEGPAVICEDGKQEWHVQGRDITREVHSWLRDNGITLPFTTEQQAEFLLRWS